MSLARLSLLYLGISDTLQMRLIPLFKVRSVQGVREKIEHGECNDKAHWLEAGFTAKPPKQINKVKHQCVPLPFRMGFVYFTWTCCCLLGNGVCLFWIFLFIHVLFLCCLKVWKKFPPKREGGGSARFSRKWEVCIYLQHNVDLMKYFLYYTNYLQFVYGGLGFLSGEFFRCSNLQ